MITLTFLRGHITTGPIGEPKVEIVGQRFVSCSHFERVDCEGGGCIITVYEDRTDKHGVEYHVANGKQGAYAGFSAENNEGYVFNAVRYWDK